MTKIFALSVILLVAINAKTEPSAVAPGQSQNRPATKTSKKPTPTYTCPMHPEVKSNKPGSCPKCKMDLRVAKPQPSAAVDSHSQHLETVTTATPADTMRPMRKMVIPDVAVLDQHGNELRFYTDLIKDKTVAINFIFTNCTTICPPLAATFARLQKEMGDKVGKDVHLISISVDPLTDTPERLKAWGGKFKAGPGWTFVTGEKQEIDRLLNALGASVAKREDHTPAMIIGNDRKGVWTRTYGLAKTGQIIGLILDVIAGKVDDSSATEEAK